MSIDSQKQNKPIALTLQGEKSKHTVRSRVWNHLEKNRLINFPRPAFGRIPNFKGADQACAKLLELEEFQLAKSVEVNPDKPLEKARVITLDKNKILYVPVPRLHDGLLKRLENTNNQKQKALRQMVNRKGLETFGKKVDFDEKITIDLLVMGSVAVSLNGFRIGKGKGYADLEYAILREMKAIDDNTVLVTIVHDTQVFDILPDDIFNKYDVPLDYILTPTRIIKINEKHHKPQGIYWNILSDRRVEAMPILKKILELHKSQGKDVALKEKNTDGENESKLTSSNNFDKRRKSGFQNDPFDKDRTKRWFYRRRSRNYMPNTDKENRNDVKRKNVVIIEDSNFNRRSEKPYRRPRRLQFDYSLLVSNIQRTVRLRQLKDALISHGIKPNNIIWRGHKGFCYLHYTKPNGKKNNKIEDHEPFAVDNIIEILQNLKLSPEANSNLSVKIMEPITRIETTDVTAV